jgi:hypothetical protein
VSAARAGGATATVPRPSAAVPTGSRSVAGARTLPGHRLSLVPPARTGAPRAPFVVLLGTLLTAGLAGLLFLHTALAEDSFRLHDLQNRSAALTDREQALEQEVAKQASPRRLAASAEALGMVRSANPAFIRLSDGKVLGKPKPAVAPPPPTPSAGATTEADKPAEGMAADGSPTADPTADSDAPGAEVSDPESGTAR